jgi:peroxiredoxin
MRSSWTALSLICLLLGAGCAPALVGKTALVGKAAPDFRLRDQDDQPIQLSDYQGKRSVVLVFYHSST